MSRAERKLSDFDCNTLEEVVLFIERLGRFNEITLGCPPPCIHRASLVHSSGLHIINNEVSRFMFTVNGKVTEKMTKAIWKYPRVSFGVTFHC